MSDNKRRRGRPAKDGSLRERFIMRMDNDMARRLDDLSRMTGMSRADIFREAFDGYEKLKLFQHSSSESEDEYEEYFDYFDEEDDE